MQERKHLEEEAAWDERFEGDKTGTLTALLWQVQGSKPKCYTTMGSSSKKILKRGAHGACSHPNVAEAPRGPLSMDRHPYCDHPEAKGNDESSRYRFFLVVLLHLSQLGFIFVVYMQSNPPPFSEIRLNKYWKLYAEEKRAELYAQCKALPLQVTKPGQRNLLVADLFCGPGMGGLVVAEYFKGAVS
jgi:hypothetical protein